MTEKLKSIHKMISDVFVTAREWILMVLLFPLVLADAIGLAIRERKLHIIPWRIHDTYEDIHDLPVIIMMFMLIITIPIALHIIDERNEQRNKRASEWEAKHPGKKA